MMGLEALVQLAGDGQLDYPISAYVGQMLVTGRPAPASQFYEASRNHFLRQVWDSRAVRRIRDEKKRLAAYEEASGPAADWLDTASAVDARAAAGNELTLVDARIYPAVGTQGTQSGGQWLPAVRIPFSSIDLWWIVDGVDLAGSAGTQGWAGVAFDIST